MHVNDEAWDDLNWTHPVNCVGCEDCEAGDPCTA